MPSPDIPRPPQIARELALLSLSQLSNRPPQDDPEALQKLLSIAVRTLQMETSETLEMAAAELQRGNARLLDSETVAPSLGSARTMVKEAIDLTETAINRLGHAIAFPQLIHQYDDHKAVRDYALQLLSLVAQNRQELDSLISKAMVNWQLERLARIDSDILRISVAEILYLQLPEQIAIDEAVKLAKRYSGEEEFRFINGVLRRVVNLLKKEVPNSRS
ncbi:transcription antitermination factor NusB [Roseofilum casamattae]|uniref:Transcription antitermination protein NusB n=1 Tax=Roseofilum casamattae BLCC-M143 TaxID=3022442 RepID=A0ABT7BTN4_9CYAN|nr:transcription antitermination factor NusB [Roseofilum casamattae]MDJ1182551.1 transcription antitermination factor NusB [Roseofilum casamattae BLCC-M143]